MAIPLDELVNITVLTIAVTVGATALGSLLGIPLGVLLVLERFPGRGAIRTIVYALYAFPPIVAGVLLYLLLRREGPLGDPDSSSHPLRSCWAKRFSRRP